MNISEWFSLLLILIGALFFFAGTVGLLRFPDVYSRLHALTKADNVGLGLIVAGLILQTGSWMMIIKVLLIWMLAMFSSAIACHLVARAALRDNVSPWRRP